MRNYNFEYLVEKVQTVTEMAKPSIYSKMAQSDGDAFQKFNSIYSEVVNYITNQRSYSKEITLTNAVAGDKFIYRIKNEKFYTPIMGETIYTVNYSDINNIEILTNAGNKY